MSSNRFIKRLNATDFSCFGNMCQRFRKFGKLKLLKKQTAILGNPNSLNLLKLVGQWAS